MPFYSCCICNTDVDEESISEFEAQYLHTEGVCVDCKLGIDDELNRAIPALMPARIRVAV